MKPVKNTETLTAHLNDNLVAYPHMIEKNTNTLTSQNYEALPNKSMAQIKNETLNKIINNITVVNFYQVCSDLGWKVTTNKDGTNKPPSPKHYKVAIVDELFKVAKQNNWHIIREAGSTYIYTGSFWIAYNKDEFKNFLKRIAIKQGVPPIEARDSLFIDKLYEQAIQDGYFSEKAETKQSMINLQNCTLVINEQGVTTKEFDYRDFLTYQLPFRYEPNAVYGLFQQYLDDVLPVRETQRTLQEVIGYLFVYGLKLEKMFFLYGTGANGKSVLFEVLNGIIGEDNFSQYSLEKLTDSTGYTRAMIKDKIVNYGTDINLNRIDPGYFKTLASGEPIEARLPYGDPFMIQNYAKFIFNVNRLDNTQIEHTHGFYRRLLIIPFNQTIPEEKQDKHLHKKILNNRAGILNWIIEGAKRVIKNGTIMESDECKQFKSQFIKESDSVALYLDSEGYASSDFDTVLLSKLYEDYKLFCANDGYTKLGKKNFAKRVEALGHERVKVAHNKDAFRLGKRPYQYMD